ncbi:MAG TPA: hypothetical protein VFB59_01125 [Candidatus Saccharimonadales bacterium]|nr:hypothetical protein [Candidatus Saccharimonadales bacterium]
MSKYKQFIFKSYEFKAKTGVLQLHYAMDDRLYFTESYKFNFPFVDYDAKALDRALQALFFLAGVSYYKTYIPCEIVVKQGELDAQMATFFSKTYQRGLGEFWYINKLDPRTPVIFPATTEKIAPLVNHKAGKGLLVAIGGGKDSLVSVELLRNKEDLMTWSVNHRPQLAPLVKKIALPHAWVERTWDMQLLELNKQDALNGHIPISGIFACVGTIVAILAGKKDIVMSNEQSANEPTLHYQGVAINHQYSKSQEFEQDYQAYLAHTQGDSLRYYSFLRPLSEVRIAEIFAKVGFEKYKDVFSSCNRAFVHGSDRMSWCGECSKCAFVFLAFTPFIERKELEKIWGGKNLLLDPKLEPTYRKLLGIEGDKPLDCVGDIKESRSAMREAFKIYPELQAKYHFEIPNNYDYRSIHTHHMPKELYNILMARLDDAN